MGDVRIVESASVPFLCSHAVSGAKTPHPIIVRSSDFSICQTIRKSFELSLIGIVGIRSVVQIKNESIPATHLRHYSLFVRSTLNVTKPFHWLKSCYIFAMSNLHNSVPKYFQIVMRPIHEFSTCVAAKICLFYHVTSDTRTPVILLLHVHTR